MDKVKTMLADIKQLKFRNDKDLGDGKKLTWILEAFKTSEFVTTETFKLALKALTFDEGRLGLLNRMDFTPGITCSCLFDILRTFGWDKNKLKAVNLLKSHIVDPEKKKELLTAFDWPKNRVEVMNILNNAQEIT